MGLFLAAVIPTGVEGSAVASNRLGAPVPSFRVRRSSIPDDSCFVHRFEENILPHAGVRSLSVSTRNST
jgi:hypothetical protein